MGRGQRAEEGTHLVAAGQRQGGKAEEWLQSLEGIVETCQLSCRRQGVLSGCCRLCGVCTPAAVVLLLVRGGAGTDRPLNESVWVSQLLATQSQRAGQGEPRKKATGPNLAGFFSLHPLLPASFFLLGLTSLPALDQGA